MSSLVLELQAEALNPGAPVSALLRKAKAVATKLGLAGPIQWIDDELNGYAQDAKVPEYRVVSAELKGLNPMRGWQPAMFKDTETHNAVSRRGAKQSVAELEDLMVPRKNGELVMAIDPETHQAMCEAFGFETQYRHFVGRASIAGILDAVRNKVLEWALALECEGITGEGMTFSPDDQRRAQASAAVYNINNNIGSIADGANVNINQPMISTGGGGGGGGGAGGGRGGDGGSVIVNPLPKESWFKKHLSAIVVGVIVLVIGAIFGLN